MNIFDINFDFFQLLSGQLINYFFVLIRVSAFIFTFPGFGDGLVSIKIRGGISLCVTIIVAPIIFIDVELSFYAIFWELCIGLFFGFLVRMLIFCLQVVGAVISQVLSFTQMFNHYGSGEQSVFSSMMTLLGISLIFTEGGALIVFEIIIRTYSAIPTGYEDHLSLIEFFFLMSPENLPLLALMLSLPFLIISLVYHMAMGFLNRLMPSLMVFMIGVPALLLSGTLVLAGAAMEMMSIWLRYLKYSFL